jgi:hypothetical protein
VGLIIKISGLKLFCRPLKLRERILAFIPMLVMHNGSNCPEAGPMHRKTQGKCLEGQIIRAGGRERASMLHGNGLLRCCLSNGTGLQSSQPFPRFEKELAEFWRQSCDLVASLPWQHHQQSLTFLGVGMGDEDYPFLLSLSSPTYEGVGWWQLTHLNLSCLHTISPPFAKRYKQI